MSNKSNKSQWERILEEEFIYNEILDENIEILKLIEELEKYYEINKKAKKN